MKVQYFIEKLHWSKKLRKTENFSFNLNITHIAQNITETCQKFFQSFSAIEIFSQHFCQLFENISLQH